MFAPSPFTVTHSVTHSTHSDVEAMAVKRARMTEAVPYTEVDFEKLSLNVREDKDKRKFIDLVSDGFVPHMNLTPTGSLEVIYGFEMTGSMENRSFNSTAEAKSKNESLSIVVSCLAELATTLKLIDERCNLLYFNQGFKGEWKTLVPDGSDEGSKNVRMHVCLKGDCTPIKVKADEMLKGEGFDFLKTCPGSEVGFRSAKVKITVKPRIWEITGKTGLAAGVSLAATFLFIQPGAKKAHVDPFADDDEF